MKGGSDDTSKCTVQAKHGRNGKVVFATLSRLGILLPITVDYYPPFQFFSDFGLFFCILSLIVKKKWGCHVLEFWIFSYKCLKNGFFGIFYHFSNTLKIKINFSLFLVFWETFPPFFLHNYNKYNNFKNRHLLKF